MKFNRLMRWQYLNAIYAPGGKPGFYYVMSECVTVWCQYLTVVGYIILLNGKMVRGPFNI